jgi:hypothetical protein
MALGRATVGPDLRARPVPGYLVGLAQVGGGLAFLRRRSDPTWSGVHHRSHARSYLLGAPATWF